MFQLKQKTFQSVLFFPFKGDLNILNETRSFGMFKMFKNNNKKQNNYNNNKQPTITT